MRGNASPSRWAWLAVLGICAFIVAFGAGCGSSDDGGSTGEELTTVGEGEGELNLICWAGYCEDGSTDPKVDWVTPFEKKTGCEVNVKIGNTSDEMVSLMRTGEYDGVSASGDATLRLIDNGDVDPVNTDLVPNYKDVFPGLKDQPYNSVDGQMYGIPHGRGANLLMSNLDVVKPQAESLSAVFDEAELEKYKGKVTAYDSPIYIADAALYLMATQPDLGITNPYELDDDQFNAAIDLLKTQNEYIGEYWSDYTKEISAFTNGDSVVGTTWQVINQLLQGDNQPVDAVVPKEGSTGWSDTWMISSESQHPNCMYEWMDWIISPKVNAEVAEWFGEAPANSKACDFTSDPNHCEIYDADGSQYLDDLYYWTTPLSDCGDDRGDVCKTYDDWVQGWTEVKG
ncbi:MAG: ABC transporter substrate-binding protein [Solirubrobacterales bacterium]|nr:ABC transporter substrate-binding protein [Solirubrobacterales bacterium]MCB8971083.1 ABC transporter substrate-binding protein [Thermoleophilales bacterium]MCO5328407.1 ABC transporter substrate-binding protein [Solirubrobacterales bacterium]